MSTFIGVRRASVIAAILLLRSSAAFATFQQTGAGAPTPKGESQQIVDTTYDGARVRRPAFHRGRGPVVMVDGGHHNFHTAAGRYRPFAKLLEDDGFVVRDGSSAVDDQTLTGASIYVIANALAARNEPQSVWRLPISPAFTAEEIAAIVRWVEHGGSLLLIADHMPFPGAIAELASAIGFHFADGFALFGTVDTATGDYPIVFRRRDGTLHAHAITNGRGPAERIDSIVTFTGSAFHPGVSAAAALLSLPRGTRLVLPTVAWVFDDTTPEMPGDGLLQGAVRRVGRGRVAVFGEAGMFSAQRKGVARVPMGFNAPNALQNPQFILNVLHWLARLY